MADFDVLVIGSGFGGSVTALRLAEKGYRVGVLEAGRRFTDATLPKNSWHLRDFIWAPKLGCTGIQRIHVLKDCVILAGAGVGGGSLNYANTLYEPPQPFYDDPQWAHITDWRDELAPHYEQAKRMLGVVTYPGDTPSDREMQRLADQFGVAQTYRKTPVGVFFGRDGDLEPGRTVPDPYFGGVGPERTGCIDCGECMTGCRHGAKNTLVKNYLALAETAGAVVHPLTTVTGVRPLAGGGYAVDTVRTGRWFARTDRSFTADAGRVLGRDVQHPEAAAPPPRHHAAEDLAAAGLPDPHQLRVAARRADRQAGRGLHAGVAITSSWHPDENTHIEPVPLRQGQQRDGPAEHDHDRRRHAAAAVAAVRDARSCAGRRWCGCSCPAAGRSG